MKKNLKILIVEDNLMNQTILQMIFREMGIITDKASNGVEALQRLSDKNYDIIFMDVEMPIMDGIKTTEVIRERWPQKDLHIVALTASATKDACMAAGMDDFLRKPVEIIEIEDCLNRYAFYREQTTKRYIIS